MLQLHLSSWHLITQKGIRISDWAFGFTSYKDSQRSGEKIQTQLPTVESPFLSSSFIFPLWKLGWMLRAFVNCAKTVLPALALHGAMVLTLRQHFFIFRLSKAEQGPLHTCQLQRGWVSAVLTVYLQSESAELKKKIHSPVCNEFSPPTSKLVA